MYSHLSEEGVKEAFRGGNKRVKIVGRGQQEPCFTQKRTSKGGFQ